MDALTRAQAPLVSFAQQVFRFDRSHPGSGYAAVSIDPSRDSVLLSWHGAVPQAVSAMLASARARGIDAQVRQARYSLGALLKAEKQLAATLTARQVHFASIAPNLDGSGLTLTRPAATAAVNAFAASAIAQTAVPVAQQAGAVPQLNDRFNDTSPFWGGDYMQAAKNAGPACSSGFPVEDSTGERFLLTASHCSPTGIGTWYTGSGSAQVTIGSVAGWAGAEDAMIISTQSQGDLYVGSSLEDDAGQAAMPVNGAGDPTVGELDCTDGSFSGSECDVKVVATNLTIQACETNGPCATYDRIAQGEQQSHLSAGGNGDSGGPVYQTTGSGANARGTDTAGDPTNASAACQGVPAGNGRSCSWRVFFPDVLYELADFGDNVVTNGN